MESNNLTRITSADANSNVLAKSKPGVLSRILVPKADAHVVTLYDGIDITTLSNNKIIAVLPASFAAGHYPLHYAFSKGLVIAVSASYAGEMEFFHRAG